MIDFQLYFQLLNSSPKNEGLGWKSPAYDRNLVFVSPAHILKLSTSPWEKPQKTFLSFGIFQRIYICVRNQDQRLSIRIKDAPQGSSTQFSVIIFMGKESEKIMCVYIYVYIYIKLNHFCYVYLKLLQHCKSTKLQYEIKFLRTKDAPRVPSYLGNYRFFYICNFSLLSQLTWGALHKFIEKKGHWSFALKAVTSLGLMWWISRPNMVSVPLSEVTLYLRLGIDEMDEGLGRGSYLLTKRAYWSLTWLVLISITAKDKEETSQQWTEHQREKGDNQTAVITHTRSNRNPRPMPRNMKAHQAPVMTPKGHW